MGGVCILWYYILFLEKLPAFFSYFMPVSKITLKFIKGYTLNIKILDEM
nr:MAG TPA: hypothetical protein [Caudoviricetes sp.]